MITERGETDHGVDVFCLGCGDRLLDQRLECSIVHGDGRGWWVLCPECANSIDRDYVLYQVTRLVRMLRSTGIDIDLRVDGKEH